MRGNRSTIEMLSKDVEIVRITGTETRTMNVNLVKWKSETASITKTHDDAQVY